MATRKTTCTTTYATPLDAASSLDLIHAKLREAHSTLDLIYSALAHRDHAGLFLETVDPETLCEAMHSVMARIEETREALDQLPAQHQVTEQAHGEVRQ